MNNLVVHLKLFLVAVIWGLAGPLAELWPLIFYHLWHHGLGM